MSEPSGLGGAALQRVEAHCEPLLAGWQEPAGGSSKQLPPLLLTLCSGPPMRRWRACGTCTACRVIRCAALRLCDDGHAPRSSLGAQCCVMPRLPSSWEWVPVDDIWICRSPIVHSC